MKWKEEVKNFNQNNLEKLILDYDFLQTEGYLGKFSFLRSLADEVKEDYGEISFSLLASEIYHAASRELIRRAYKI